MLDQKPEVEPQADQLRSEAKDLLNSLLNLPPGVTSNAADRFVDCVIGSAVLQVVALLVQSKSDQNRG